MKQLWNDLKRVPGLLIGAIVVIALLLYTLWKQNNSSGTTNQQPTYELNTVSVTPPPPAPEPEPTPKPKPKPVPTPTDFLATHVRNKQSHDKGSGVNVYSTPGGKVSRTIKYGSAVDVTGLTTNVKGVDYYPIKGGGFIRERDLVGVG